MKRGRLLWSIAPAIFPKLPLFTSETGPLKNCAELRELMKSVRKSKSNRCVIWIAFMTDISTLCTPGLRTVVSRVGQVCSVCAPRTAQTGVSLPTQFRVAPPANSVHVLNHRAKPGFDKAGLPIGTEFL